jgi:hypothetical protein
VTDRPTPRHPPQGANDGHGERSENIRPTRGVDDDHKPLSPGEIRQRCWALVGADLAEESPDVADLILADLDRAALVDLVHALAATVAHDLAERAPSREILIERVHALALQAALAATKP